MNKESYLSISTSTSFSKIRGFTVELLFQLKNCSLRTADLVELTGKCHQYVNRCLQNMRIYGLVEKNSLDLLPTKIPVG